MLCRYQGELNEVIELEIGKRDISYLLGGIPAFSNGCLSGTQERISMERSQHAFPAEVMVQYVPGRIHITLPQGFDERDVIDLDGKSYSLRNKSTGALEGRKLSIEVRSLRDLPS